MYIFVPYKIILLTKPAQVFLKTTQTKQMDPVFNDRNKCSPPAFPFT